MNRKGFAITTVVYGIIILLILLIGITVKVMKNQYINQKQLVKEINEVLEEKIEEDYK